MDFAERISRIQPSATLAMTAKAAELRDKGFEVLNMSVGEPDFNTPNNIIIETSSSSRAIKEITL